MQDAPKFGAFLFVHSHTLERKLALWLNPFLSPNRTTMKKPLLFTAIILSAILFLSSCSRGITVYDAANGKAKCGRYVK